jgi:hypothetical protein
MNEKNESGSPPMVRHEAPRCDGACLVLARTRKPAGGQQHIPKLTRCVFSPFAKHEKRNRTPSVHTRSRVLLARRQGRTKAPAMARKTAPTASSALGGRRGTNKKRGNEFRSHRSVWVSMSASALRLCPRVRAGRSARKQDQLLSLRV